jgi:hypothetical protein
MGFTGVEVGYVVSGKSRRDQEGATRWGDALSAVLASGLASASFRLFAGVSAI